MDDKRKVLYDQLSKGYELGDFDSFSAKLDDESKRKAFYDAVSKDYDLGDYESFVGKIKKPAAQIIREQSTGEPYTHKYDGQGNLVGGTAYETPEPYHYKPEVQQHIAENIPSMFKSNNASLMDKPLGDSASLPELSDDKFQARIDVAQKNLQDPEVQKARTDAHLRGLSASVDTDLNDIEDRIVQRKKAVRNENWKPGMPSSRNDRDLSELRGERSYLEGAKELIEESQKIVTAANDEKDGTFVGGFLRGVRDKAFDVDNWTMGISDLVGGLRLKKVLEDYEAGKQLSPAQEKLLDAAITNMATSAWFESDLGRGYKAGQVKGESLPFMLEMMVNPISASGNAMAKSLLTAGLKRFGSVATNKAVKAGTRLATDALAATGMAATTGLPGVLGESVDRMNRNYEYGFDADGNLNVTKTGDTSFGEALGRSFTTRALENQSEMIFNAFRGAGAMMRGVERYIPGGVNRFFDAVSNSKVGQLWREIKNSPLRKEIAQAAQIGGIGEEYLEEVYNNMANVALGEMSFEEAIDLDRNIDTFLGLAPTQVLFSAVGLGGMAYERYKNRKEMERVFGLMSDEQKKKLEELQQMGKLSSNKDIAVFIRETMADESLTPEERRAEIEYAYDLAKQNAINEVDEAEVEDRVETDNNQIDAATDPATGLYGEVNLIRKDLDGNDIITPANVFNEKIVDGELYLLVQAEGETKKDWVRPDDYDADSYERRPAEEVKAINEEMVREQAAAQAERESKYAPDILSYVPKNDDQVVDANGQTLTIVGVTPDGIVYMNEQGKTEQMPLSAWKDLLQAQYEAQEAEKAQAEEVAANAQAIVDGMQPKPMNDGTGRIMVPKEVKDNKVIYNITDAEGNVIDEGSMDVAKFNEVEKPGESVGEQVNSGVNAEVKKSEKPIRQAELSPTAQKVKGRLEELKNSGASQSVISSSILQEVKAAKNMLNKAKKDMEAPIRSGVDAVKEMQKRKAILERAQKMVDEYSSAFEELGLDENVLPFVKTSSDTYDFGMIDEGRGLKSAPIRLSQGYNKVDDKGNNHGYGLEHIEVGHGEQIRKAGFESVEDFVSAVASNYQTIRKGNKRNGEDTYLLEVSDGKNNTLFVELAKDGRYWNVNSAGVFREGYSKNKEVVWTLPAVEQASTAEASEVQDAGQSSKAGNPLSGNSPQTTSSTNKDSEKNVQSQEKEQKPLHEREKEDVFRELGDKYGEKMPHKVEVTAKAWAEKIAKAQKKVDEAQQKLDDSPIGEDDKPKAALDKAQSDFDAIKREADFWAEMDAEIKDAQKRREEILNPSVEAQSASSEPMTADEFVAQQIAAGNIVLNKEDYKNETGYGDEEANAMNGGTRKLFAENGMTIQEAGERLAEIDRENGGVFFGEDSQAARDALISVLGSVKSRKELNGYIASKRDEQAKRDAEGARNEAESAVMDAHFASLEDFVLQMEAAEVENPFVDVDLDRIDAIFAEAEEEYQNFINNEQGRTSEIAEGNDNVLSEEQSDNTGRTEGIEDEGNSNGNGEGTLQEDEGAHVERQGQINGNRGVENTDNGVQEWYSQIHLSGELDQNNSPFISSPSGGIDFGKITEIHNLPSAPIRLSMGDVENGYIHINRRHGKQIQKAGFNSIEEFVKHVVDNFTRIQEGDSYKNASGGTNNTYLVQLQDKHNNTLFIQLSRNGEYWNVNSAGVFNKSYGNKKKNIWSASEVQNNNPAVVSDGLQSEPNADNGSTSNGTPSNSIDKDSNLPENNKENKENVSLKQQEGETTLQFAERMAKENERRTPLRKRIREWAASGVKVNVIENLNDVTNAAAANAIRKGSIVSGWYEEHSNEVFIYLPHVENLQELDFTIIHEALAHKGLRGMLGKERFNELCDKVWDMMSESKRTEYLEYVGDKFSSEVERQRAAADEYMAFLAEGVGITPEEKTIWDNIVKLFRDMLDKVLNDMLGKSQITNKDISELIKMSYANLKSGNAENVRGEGTRFNAKKVSDRRQEMNRVNNTVDQALSLVYGKDVREIRKERQEREQKRKEDAAEIYQSVLSGDFNDVTLQKINDYIDDSTPLNPFGRRISQRLPQKLERKLLEGARTNVVDALFSRISESAVPASRRASEDGRREIEERKKEALKGWAIATGNWHTDLSEFTDEKEPFAEGTDSKVYAAKEDGYVIKTSFGKPTGKRFRPDIDTVALFNRVFPNSPYEIVGYGEFDGKFARILKQPAIDFAEVAQLSVDERVEYMRSLGFEPINEAKTAFSNGEIIAADIQKSNIVKDAMDNVTVIDADMKLHTKDVGGNYTYPPVEADLPEDTRFRFIGERGARNLDKAEEATTRLDNLAVARDMESAFNAKKERIEKLKDSEPIEILGTEIPFSEDLKQYKKNALEYGKTFRGNYTNKDTGESVFIGKNGLKEVLNHDYKNVEQLQSVAAIPSIIENSIYIESRKNNDNKVDAEKFDYYVCGLKIGEEDYTVRAVFVTPKDGTRYYDHKLTKIEKGNLLDSLIGTTPGFNQTDFLNSENKDTVLVSILQTNDKENAKKIKMATGWERGADGLWRYEVDDNIDFELRRPHKEELKKAYDEANEKYYRMEMRVPVRIPKNATEEERQRIKDMRKELSKLRRAMNKAFDAYYDYSAESAKLGEFLDKDNQLFKEYPELADYDVSFLRDTRKLAQGLKGSFTPEYKTIWLDDARPKGDVKSSLIHEIQHAIQGIEGFAQGGTPSMFDYAKYYAEDSKDSFRQFINRFGFEDWEKNLPFEQLMAYGKEYKGQFGGLHRAFINNAVESEDDRRTLLKELDYVKEMYDKFYQIAGGMDAAYKFKDSNEWYRSLSGEVESRNVQQRMGMTDEQRRNTLASETEDVAREDQIFLKNAVESGSRFRISDKGRKIQKKVDEFASKYNSMEVILLDSEMTDEEVKALVPVFTAQDVKEYIEKGIIGGYSSELDKISIFADNQLLQDVEDSMFHENLHGLLEDKQDLIESFFKLAEPRFPKNIEYLKEQGYKDKDIPEELFVRLAAKAMDYGIFDDVIYNLPEDSFEVFKELIKGFGYEYGQEIKSRVLGKGGRGTSHLLEGEEIHETRRNGRTDSESKGKEKERASREAEQLGKLYGQVADMGLDGVLGNKEYTKTMVDIFKLFPDEVRTELADSSLRNYKGSIAPAVSDYLNHADASIWDKVVAIIRDAIRRVGFDIELNANDVKYILWRSQKKLNRNNLLDVAEDIDKKYKLGVGEYSPTRFRVGKKKASETALPEDESSFKGTVISDADRAKVLKNLDILQTEYENKSSKGSKTFIGDLAKALQLRNNGNNSNYGDYVAVNGDEVTIRVSDHNVSVSDMDAAGKSNGISIVVGRKANEGIRDYGDAHIVEFYYNDKKLRNAEGNPYTEIINSFKQTVYSGEYKDTTGLAERQEVNPTLFRTNVKKGIEVRDEYEALTKKSGFQAREAVQDAMLSLRRVQELIEKATGKKLRDFENAWMHENRLSSVVQAEIHDMERKFYKPMIEAVKKLMKVADMEQNEVADYLMLKHGIERNREMAVRKALTDADGKIDKQRLADWYRDKRNVRNRQATPHLDTWRKQQEELDNLALLYGADMSVDYSGLTSMFDTDDLEECTNRAYDEVEGLENAHQAETEALGKAIKALTQSTLDKSFESGLMNKAVYDELSNDMYDYYIPLRGFEETTSDEVYAYFDGERGAFNAPLRRAKGRTSKSDNPIAYMKSIAESGIMQGNRNKMKQTFLNMVINNPSDLISVKEGVWAAMNPATGEWEAVSTPPIPNNATPADVEAIMEQWEADMELQAASNSNIKKITEADDVPYRVIGNRINQHQVIVKRLGKSYTLTVNGNPRLAMALNGQTNPNNTSNDGKVIEFVSKKIDAINRQLSAWYTTRNPDFVASNFMRDTFYTNTIVRAKEGYSYANKFHKHYVKLLMPGKMMQLFYKYENGTLDSSKPVERDFLEFMMNGGETGYSNLKDLEHIKSKIAKELKGSKMQKVENVLERLDIVNRAVENTARFAAYRTSRQMGRTVAKSIFDAKEISVNFNKKGAGGTFFGMTGQTRMGNLAAAVGAGGRAFYVFFNAAIQGTTNLMHVMRVNPVGTGAGVAAMFLMGALIPMLLDDEKEYYDLPEHVRRNHLILPGMGDAWVSIPLPIEYRIMYGMGELLTSWRTGHERGKDIARKMLSLSGQALPLNFMEEGLDAFIPSAISPLWQAYNNKSWTGLPIYKDNEFNKKDPEYTKAYSNTNRNLVKFTKALYEWTFDEESQSEGIDLNPAIIETIARGYFSGAFTTVSNISKTIGTIQGEREFDWRNIPIGNRVFKTGDERTKEKRITNEYFENMEELEFMQSRERMLKKVINGAAVPEEDKVEARRDYEIMQGSETYKKFMDFKKKKKEVDKVRKTIKDKGTSEELEKKLSRLQDEANKLVR